MSTIPSKRKAPVDPAQQQAEAQRRTNDINDIARRRAQEIAARIAGRSTNGATTPAARTSAPSLPAPGSQQDEAAKKLAAAKARIEARNAAATPPPTQTSVETPSSRAATPAPAHNARSALDDLQARIAARRANRGNPPRPPSASKPDGVTAVQDGGAAEKRDAVPQPSRGVTPANAPTPDSEMTDVREATPVESKPNPYLPKVHAVKPARELRQFTLQRVGKESLQQAVKHRHRDAIDEFRTQMRTKREKAAGELSVFSEPEPPEREWWDIGLINEMDGDIDDSLVTNGILHPVVMEPVQAMLYSAPEAKTYLTKREIKKKRRINRFHVTQEKNSKIRLGLEPPPEPKINAANAMKVYPEMAVTNPSLLQKKTQDQVAARAAKHEADNMGRQLTKEQREQKTKENAEKNVSQGLYLSIYHIHLNKDELQNKHKYKINTNVAQWHDATGILIIAPSATFAIVEAGDKASKKLRKLFCNRTKWQAIRLGHGDITAGAELLSRELAKPIEDRAIPPECWDQINNVDNTCQLVWQGQFRNRKFKKWGGVRLFDTDDEAKALLGAVKLQNVWGALGVKAKAAAPVSKAPPVQKAVPAQEDDSAEKAAPVQGVAPQQRARSAKKGDGKEPEKKFNLPAGAHDRAISEWMASMGKKAKYSVKLDEFDDTNGVQVPEVDGMDTSP
jgi:U4/U6 small nuclear ribonucleoprotein PRP3